MDSSPGRRVIATTLMGSAITMLTATVVGVALPAIASDLDAGSGAQQWVVTGYLLTMSSLLLVGGSLGDRLGRVRSYRIGAIAFAVASLMCAAAPTVGLLIAARVAQGAGAAMLIPGSLAIIEATIRPDDRGRAVGSWSGLGGVAGAIGPLVGGALVALSWRWVFVLVIPLAAAVLILSRKLPESFDRSARSAPLDVGGALLTMVVLGTAAFALIEGPEDRLGSWPLAAGGISAAAAAGLFVWERRAPQPIVPIDLFRIRPFVAANLVTLLVYGGMGVVFFLLPIQLQVAVGWSPTVAGSAMVPITLLMLALSSTVGGLAQRIGPRWPLTIGPLGIAAGMVLLSRIGPAATYWGDVVPAVVVMGIGMVVSVAPVTSTALGSVPDERVGAASGLNNAVSGFGQTLTVAAVPPLAGLTGSALADPVKLDAGYPTALLIGAGLVALAAPVSLLLFRSSDRTEESATSPAARVHCGVESARQVTQR